MRAAPSKRMLVCAALSKTRMSPSWPCPPRASVPSSACMSMVTTPSPFFSCTVASRPLPPITMFVASADEPRKIVLSPSDALSCSAPYWPEPPITMALSTVTLPLKMTSFVSSDRHAEIAAAALVVGQEVQVARAVERDVERIVAVAEVDIAACAHVRGAPRSDGPRVGLPLPQFTWRAPLRLTTTSEPADPVTFRRALSMT